ncbi:MAG: 4Fe-4S dicluster domain-containing protein [Planctomycetes bacterium]|nr:4Fe-4S dicluster domain-containing protein [Planctomycetota bacterium]
MNHPTSHDELLFPGDDPSPSRRAFLRLAGFGIAAGSLAGCSRRAPTSALSWTQAPEDVVAGRAWWIATTCGGCPSACGALARCRDGRPVKLEGNELDVDSRGGLCAAGQAALLGVYDSQRVPGPRWQGRSTTWAELDSQVGLELDALRKRGKVRVLTSTIHSPSTRRAIQDFVGHFADARHVAYDVPSAAALLDAHMHTHGVRVLPDMRFERARVVAAFEADFLGTWIAPVHFAARHAERRVPGGDRSMHVQFESRLSLTGSRADRRTRIAPHELRAALERLRDEIAVRAGAAAPARSSLREELGAAIERIAEELWGARGASLVVCGTNDLAGQLLVNEANALLENYGRTLDLARPSLQRSGDDRALEQLAGELERGEIDMLVCAGCNPAYELPSAFARALGRVKTLVTCSPEHDETARIAHCVAPEPHFLECWNDAEPFAGSLRLTQPTVPPLRDARTLRSTLRAWLGDTGSDREHIEEHWREAIWPRARGSESFEAFFRRALHDGVVELPRENVATPAFRGRVALEPSTPGPAGATLVLYAKVTMPSGAHAHNPWLQELPDPISKATWGNYACIAPGRAASEGLSDGDVVRVEAGGAVLELPVYVQRGQHEDVVAVALGYGRVGTDRFMRVGPQWIGASPTVDSGDAVGVNAAPMLAFEGGYLRSDVHPLRLVRTGRRAELARTQEHDTLQLPEDLAPHGHAERDLLHARDGHGGHGNPGLWPDDHANDGPRWGMTIDLERCTGCSACVVACQAENNVPVVGRDEVARHREMSWLRIDRYFAGEGDEVRADFQPMLCQHCANAPCEAVCPVLATVHSAEGLNQQVYNRCVGTRYCANTCPYKVRRFNWFDYAREDELANHSLNPDVTVRSRGVMEKCSFCVQRIQEAKFEARRTGRPLADGDVRPACAQSCPARAITFGDLADAKSAVARATADPRAFALLEELNVQPSIRYLGRERRAGRKEDPHGH